MESDHSHSAGDSRRVYIALSLTATFMVVEVAGGILLGSLALLADAGHMLTDTMALALAAVALRISTRPPDPRRTYGYHRFQILAAFVNGLGLLAIVAWIVIEALQRLVSPSEVLGEMMLIVAGAGLLVNIVAFLVLHGGDLNNLNIRAATMHVVGDLLGSVAAIIAAVIILTSGWMPIDPLLSILVAALILRSAWSIVRQSAHILLEGTPDSLDLLQMEKSIVAAVPEIAGIHHVHVWGLTPQRLMLTMHITVTCDHREVTGILRRVKAHLHSEFGISHSTVEVEKDDCSDHVKAARADS